METKPIIEGFDCPMCESFINHVSINGTHVYKCDDCPFIGFEFYTDNDIKNLMYTIK